ncbi:MAG: type IV pili methyl-accepting chemotaxis transducer N-terminal domain-containing protein [Rhodocyclaceae bacterium]|nr:type IV pili methyl-accepting chemotaxis transducer N-terminal domain-containing protein [Rhodocyclaceae bacterium]
MKRLSALLGLVLAALLATAGDPAQAQIANINDAINKAGSLRYAANRLAKVYFQIGMGIEVDRSRRILDSQIAMYDRRVVELKNYAPTPEIKESYIALEKAWSGYKDLLVGAKPNPEAGRKLVGVSEEVVAIANKATGQLAAHSGTTQGKLVNISGRQRMLSQRIAKYYQAQAWGVAPADSQAQINKSRAEFSQMLGELAAAQINTPQIKEELDLGKQQWMFFEQALMGRGGDKKANSTNVATTSERILEVMDNVVGMYEKLLK